MKMLTRYDICIVIIVLLATVVSYCAVGFDAANEAPYAVEITVDSKLYANYNLTDAVTPQIVKISTEFGNNVLKITSDGAEMTESDCPDHLDVKCGKITKVGQVIVCVPNRVVVKLIGNGERNVDKVTY